MRYTDSGVDIHRGDDLVERLQKLCPGIGGFSGLYEMGDHFLVASTDGVGTKLKLAFELDLHETIGIDLVAMCVNDVITTGARPLFLLDYFATSHLDVNRAASVLKGVIAGCQEAGCQLLGGETAEMPGFYNAGEYDIAGFTVGSVAKKDLIDGRHIKENDLLVGIASTGIHSNGFSLVREVVKKSSMGLDEPFQNSGQTLGEILITPTRIYVKQLFDILGEFPVKGVAHITGGGLVENVPRMLPDGKIAYINKQSWRVPPIFHWLQKEGEIPDDEMDRTFNMGIGLVLAMAPEYAKKLCKKWSNCSVLGEVMTGENKVVWA